MNRESNLKITLPINLDAIKKYPQMSIIVLNYNSRGDLDSYIRTINNPQLKYYIEKTVKYFNMAHSKNLVTRLSDAYYTINLDADNILNDDYLQGLVIEAEKDTDYLSICKQKCFDGLGLDGRLGCKTKLFHKLRGYEESLEGWGCEDFDFAKRLLATGCTVAYIRITDEMHCVLLQTDEEKGANYKVKDIKGGLLANYLKVQNISRSINKSGYGMGTVYDINNIKIELTNQIKY